MHQPKPFIVDESAQLRARRDVLRLVLGLLASAPTFFHKDAFSGQAERVDQFIGELSLTVTQRDGAALYVLENDYGYVDPAGRRWQAKKGLETDGATIPSILWPIVGHPFQGLYVNAAIIHDYYCIKSNRFRDWQSVHRAFKDAMLTNGVDRKRAALMFFAVWRFGPRWKIADLVPCTPGPRHFCSQLRATEYRIVDEDLANEPTDADKELLLQIKGEIEGDYLQLEEIPKRESELQPLHRVTSERRVPAKSEEGWQIANPDRTRFAVPK